MSKPKGVMVILVHPRGHVAATGSSFATAGPGGFSRIETQTREARMRCQQEYLRKYAAEELARVVGRSLVGSDLLGDLVQQEGFRLHREVIGHDADE